MLIMLYSYTMLHNVKQCYTRWQMLLRVTVCLLYAVHVVSASRWGGKASLGALFSLLGHPTRQDPWIIPWIIPRGEYPKNPG